MTVQADHDLSVASTYGWPGVCQRHYSKASGIPLPIVSLNRKPPEKVEESLLDVAQSGHVMQKSQSSTLSPLKTVRAGVAKSKCPLVL